MGLWSSSKKKKAENVGIVTATPVVQVNYNLNNNAPEVSNVDHIDSSQYYVPAPTLEAQFYNRLGGSRNRSHKMCLFFSIIAGLTGFNNGVAQILALTFAGNLQMEVALRLYMIGFCSLVVLNESERFPLLRESQIFYNWIGRGVFYTFLGVLGQNLYDVGYDNRSRRYGSGSSSSSTYNRSGDYNGYRGPRMPSTEDFSEWYIWLTSFLMFVAGVVYLILGVSCIQRKLEHWRQEYNLQQSQQQQQGIQTGKSSWTGV